MKHLTPEELMERADGVGGLGALEAHGFFGRRISEGHAVRVVFRRGRRFDDLVLFQRDEDDWSGVGAPPGGEFRVLAAWNFPVPSEWGPVLVQDRVLPTAFKDPVAWVDSVVGTVEIPETGKDAPARPLMDNDRFWSLIDCLGGSLEDEKIAELTEALEALPYRDVLFFRDTLVARLRELDQPLNTVGVGEGEERVISADASLYYRCEIVAAGREVFRDRVEHPRPGRDADGASGEALLGVAEDASVSRVPEPDASIETGTNPLYWPDAPDPLPDPWASIPSPGPFSYDIQLSRLRLGPWSQRRFIVWLAYATTAEGTVREMMGCVVQGNNETAREEVVAYVRARLRDGETLHPNVVTYAPGIDGVATGHQIAGGTRRSRLSMDEYVQRYYTGELASAGMRKAGE